MAKLQALFGILALMMGVAACDGGGDGTGGGGAGGDTGGGGAGATGGGGSGGATGGGGTGGASDEAQLPPTSSAADVDAWLAKGFYKNWACEAAEHDAVSPSPHGVNRICSNDVLSAHGTGEYPVDSAGVKELWDAAGGAVIGYAVYRHMKAGTTGDTWFWYEVVPLDHPAPHDDKGVVAFGNGDTGPAKDICVGCHAAAGSDVDHSGHDFVYTQVK